MVKSYLKILNNLITKNLLCYAAAVVLILNIVIRVKPNILIKINQQSVSGSITSKTIPTGLFTFCDVYLLLLFIIIIYFFLGKDFTNSMEEIAIAIGGSKMNKFMYRKLYSTLILYFSLYVVSFINIYTLYIKLLPSNVKMISLTEILIFSFTTNLFIISLSLVILFITRNIPISIIIITAYYLIEEFLWRCKVTQTKGILGHLNQYYDYANGEIMKVKLIYIFVSVILLYILYRMSSRKRTGFRFLR